MVARCVHLRCRPMKRKHIDSNQASVAATFYEPAYQRLRQWHDGRMIDLVCFVKESNEAAQRILADYGAAPSGRFRANCFAEVWELPHESLLTGAHGRLPAQFDRAICEALGCGDQTLSAASGLLRWADNEESQDRRRHVPSQLLKEATPKHSR
jgi:hypothetical protein